MVGQVGNGATSGEQPISICPPAAVCLSTKTGSVSARTSRIEILCSLKFACLQINISTYSKERSGSKMPRGRPLEGGRPPLLPSAPLSTPRAALRLLVLH